MTVVQPKLDVALQAVHGHIPQFDVELIKVRRGAAMTRPCDFV